MSEVSETIYAAIDLFKGGDAWGQGHDAVDEKGTPVRINSEEAVKFCLRGAIARVCQLSEMSCTCAMCQVPEFAVLIRDSHHRKAVYRFSSAMEMLNKYTYAQYGGLDPVCFNDRSSYEDVVLMMKTVASAIE